MKENSLRILIAEDYKDLAESYKMVLEERGHIITTVRDGIECLDVYRDRLKMSDIKDGPYFDVVILDQQMPGMDGIDVAREIQQINIKQRIIFITGHGKEVVHRLRVLKEQVEVMNKPFTIKALIDQLEGWPLYKWREQVRDGFKEWDGYEGTSVPVGPSRTG